jgi:FtsP/CotA-like multicopper oxidase with cupredoxin domain
MTMERGRWPQPLRPCRLKVTLRNGRVVSKEKLDYEGFHTRPGFYFCSSCSQKRTLFLVVARDGQADTNPVWKDSVLLPAGSAFDLLVEFSSPGPRGLSRGETGHPSWF